MLFISEQKCRNVCAKVSGFRMREGSWRSPTNSLKLALLNSDTKQ